MSRMLATRLKKLEAKRQTRRFTMPVIFALQPEENAGEIIGLGNGGDEVPRLFGETCLTAFAARASLALGRARLSIMFASYAPSAPPEPTAWPVAAPVAPIAPPEAAGVMDFYQTAWLGR